MQGAGDRNTYLCYTRGERFFMWGTSGAPNCERTSSVPTLDGNGMGSGRELGKKQSLTLFSALYPLVSESSFFFCDPPPSCFSSSLSNHFLSLFFLVSFSSSCPFNIVPKGNLPTCMVLCITFLQQTQSIFTSNK